MKPANVLIFFKPELHAKIADFSHAFLDTGEQRQLVGGTRIYTAPEWKSSTSTNQLRKTDIYSLGLVLSGLIMGFSLIDCVKKNEPQPYLDLSLADRIQKLKDDDLMATYLYEMICLADQENPDLHLDGFAVIRSMLDSTLQLDPSHSELSIPYAALQHLSPVVMDQVVRALRMVADSPVDSRRAAACMELAICHMCDLGKSNAHEFTQRSNKTALDYLLKAAALGASFAQAIAERVSQVLQEDIPDHYPTKDWLYNAATAGSITALESLKHVDSSRHTEALEVFRSTLCGNPENCFENVLINMTSDAATIVNGRKDTVIHWLASTGQTERLRSFAPQSHILNSQNHQGDTPLLCATRAGHYAAMEQLLSCGADASVTNAAGENALHFLGSLDEQDVYSAAHMLLAAGAVPDAEATLCTGNTSLQTRPTGAGCPKLRAVLSDQSHVLRALLELCKLMERSVTLSEQRTMLAWAVRLHHAEILQVLHECFASSGLFSDLQQIRVWSDGMRQSLPEVCVRGCVSGTETAGFDMPEGFMRLVNHGSNGLHCLERTISFMEMLSPGIMEMDCGGARNALFFAIREDSPKKLEELGRRISKIHPGEGSRTPPYFHTTPTKGMYCREDEQAYQCISKPSSKKQRRRRMMDRYRGMRSPMRSPVGFHRTDSGSSDESPEDSDSGDDDSIRHSTPIRLRNEEDERKKLRPPLPATTHQPTDHYSISGHVDAIMLAALHGQRAIFYDLISGPGGHTMQTNPLFPCYVYQDRFAVHSLKGCDDFRGYFPRGAWRYPVADVRRKGKGVTEFDGTLCYPLAYMTAIARSAHRDICLAHILLMVMKQGNISEPAGWTAKSWFEDVCLSLDSCSGQSTPLFHAAALNWDELSDLLLEHGAFPQSTCFCEAQASTVLARLIAATNNVAGQVQNLLAIAASRSTTESIITLQDVSAIIGQGSHAGKNIAWTYGALCWESFSIYDEDRNMRLWQAIAAANSSQRLKLQENKGGSSALLIESVCRRDFYAVNTLLEIGVDPEMGRHGWSIFPPRVTALDIVTWTAYVSLDDCYDSGCALKERDAKLSALLRSHGGVRGVEYTVEYQLLMNFVQTLIVPTVGTALLAYALYWVTPFISVHWNQSWRITKQCAAEEDSGGIGETVEFVLGKAAAVLWGFFVAKSKPPGWLPSERGVESDVFVTLESGDRNNNSIFGSYDWTARNVEFMNDDYGESDLLLGGFEE
ncbi:hypothetical protein G7Z17_g3581 [Cylindrodendrum hubeiense]|uniref:Protein kinase domain-containing protein n=1 Tax=Cylindrodendrum hubeiense TaxID=595255 RepID=A0A9P5HFK5_9HYPO|nr:hypothetical protein G7Z17_g3581 [Cylindrodendrum hubeiense]